MQVYDNIPCDELSKASKVLTAACEREARIIIFAAWLYTYKMIAIGFSILLAAVFDHPALQFIVPVSVIATIGVIDTLLSAMKFRAWDVRNKSEKIYFEKSKAVTDYNTEKILQVIAVQELAGTLNENSAFEERVIN